MISAAVLVFASSLAAVGSANPIQVGDAAREAAGFSLIRGMDEAQRRGPNVDPRFLGGGDDYKPYEMPCPDQTWIRSASGVSRLS